MKQHLNQTRTARRLAVVVAAALASAATAVGQDAPQPAVIADPVSLRSHPIDPALELMRECKRRYASVQDYTALFVKEERIGKVLLPPNYIRMKFREKPFSVYFRWVQPETGKEAIYVEGKNDGKIITHGVGFTRALAGVMKVDPEGSLARKDNRHGIKEAGIGNLIDRIIARWEFERRYNETIVETSHVRINGRPAYLVNTIHPGNDANKFAFHTFKLYVDKELMLPIRCEGYAFPSVPGRESGGLLESYTYLDLRINVGLTELDYSPKNPNYNFSRF